MLPVELKYPPPPATEYQNRGRVFFLVNPGARKRLLVEITSLDTENGFDWLMTSFLDPTAPDGVRRETWVEACSHNCIYVLTGFSFYNVIALLLLCHRSWLVWDSQAATIFQWRQRLLGSETKVAHSLLQRMADDGRAVQVRNECVEFVLHKTIWKFPAIGYTMLPLLLLNACEAVLIVEFCFLRRLTSGATMAFYLEDGIPCVLLFHTDQSLVRSGFNAKFSLLNH